MSRIGCLVARRIRCRINYKKGEQYYNNLVRMHEGRVKYESYTTFYSNESKIATRKESYTSLL